MLTLERQEEILAILRERKSATVDELASELFVSGATVRRDLREMEKKSFYNFYQSQKDHVARLEAKYTEHMMWGILMKKPFKYY